MEPTWAQAFEDVALRRIFDLIGDGSQTCVDFGASDGIWLSNTKLFRDARWRAWLFDIEPKALEVIRAEITPDSVNDIFDEHGVPQVIDLLSIDVGGMDLWILQSILQKRVARVVIIEYNPVIPPNDPLVVPRPGVTTKLQSNGRYHPYYGASPAALIHLGRQHGLQCVGCVGVNVILVDEVDAAVLHDLPVVKPPRDARDVIQRHEWSRVQGQEWWNIQQGRLEKTPGGGSTCR